MKRISLTFLALLFCFASFAQTPAPITGPTAMCLGSTTTLMDATGGGIWSSATPSIAIVGSVSGVVTGMSSGSVIITYSVGSSFVTTTVTVFALPAVYSLTGGGSYCSGSSGVHVILNGSNSGVVYQLYVGGVPMGSSVFGTGAPIDFGPMTVAGVYSVVAADAATGCTANMSGSAVVTVTPLPNRYTVIGTGSYCAGGPGVLVSQSGSDFGIDYQLYNGSSAVGTPLPGTGSSISFGMQTAAGIYRVIATNATTMCTDSMLGSATVTISPLPTAYTVTGGGAYCIGGTGMPVGVNFTSTGVNYQLFLGSAAVSSPIAGTGSSISFGLQTTPGVYTVVATNTSTGCSNNMSGSATITVSPLPVTTYSVTGGGHYCAGGSGVHIGTSGSDTGVSYQLVSGSTMVGSPLAGTGSALDFGLQTTAGGYDVLATTTAGCSAGIMGGATITVDPAPTTYTVTGGGTICAGGAGVHIYLSNSDAGISYQLENGSTAFGSAVPGTGAMLDFGAITTAGSPYSVGAADATTGCTSVMTGTVVITVNPLPAVTASSSSACGGIYTLTAGGAATYSWSPSTGLSCATCATTTITPSVSATYTVTGTDASGCSNDATATTDGNRISGTITLGGSSTSLQVWLIQFNPSDSSITALDSTMACISGGVPYFEFMDKAPGNYIAKAKLTTSVPGTSDYIPTYGYSTPNWYAAATVAHTTATDNLNINMIYGTVPSGPGFISGYVYAGAGRGTTGDAPVSGMLIFLKDPVTGLILTYTYTDATGAYYFPGLGIGSYMIYPEAYKNSTTASPVITISLDNLTATGMNFRQYLDSKVILPIAPNAVKTVHGNEGINIFPNPANGNLNIHWNDLAAGNANMVVTDMTGREVYRSILNLATATGQAQIDLSTLRNGVYFISIRSEKLSYSHKLVIEK